jgi:hypothetical protein
MSPVHESNGSMAHRLAWTSSRPADSNPERLPGSFASQI